MCIYVEVYIHVNPITYTDKPWACEIYICSTRLSENAVISYFYTFRL
nr:MAG TPA: hypothetical protein [Caudoviricetes sp.]